METEEIEQRLWAYIDGICTTEEHNAMEKILRENSEWRALYQTLLGVHQSLAEVEIEQPSMRFTKNVMEELARTNIAPAAKNYINSKIIWGIALFFIISIVGFFIYGLGQITWTASSATPLPLNLDLTKVDYSKAFNSTVMNVFMMVNAVLGLMLLDRYLANSRRKLYKPN